MMYVTGVGPVKMYKTQEWGLSLSPSDVYVRDFLFPFLYLKKKIWYIKVLVGLHKTVQLQLLQRYWLGHRLG